MPVVSATELGAQRGEANVELVVQDDEALSRPLVVGQQRRHRSAGLIHERLRHSNDDPLPADAHTRLITARLALRRQGRAMPAGELMDCHGSDVVAGGVVARPGIAQTDNDPPTSSVSGQDRSCAAASAAASVAA